MELAVTVIFPSIVLMVAVVFDLFYKKFPNYLFITFFIIAFCSQVYVSGLAVGLGASLASLVTMSALGLVLCYIGALGAGDVKLLFVLSIFIPGKIIDVLILSIIWGGILGLVSALFHGKLKQLVLNMKNLIIYNVKPEKQNLSFIPYTVCFFLAFITHSFLDHRGVLSW